MTYFVAVDSIGYDNTILGKDRHFTRELREMIARRTPLRPDAIMLTATHAHSVPETIGLTLFRKVDGVSAWLENHLEDLSATVVEAWHKREAVVASFRRRVVEGMARYRRIILKDGKQSRYGPLPKPEDVAEPWVLDQDLSLLCMRRADGSCHSILMNYTAHPVVAMLLPEVCADYPGVAARVLQKKHAGAICLFTQGAAGNINTIRVSTNYGDVDTLGRTLGEAAIDEIAKIEPSDVIQNPVLHVSTANVQLKPRPCPAPAGANLRGSQTPTVSDEKTARLARKLDEDSLSAEIQLMRVGKVKWISLPGEPFVESGLALKRAGASFVVGYANGWHGYFPIRRAYGEGGYEVELGAWSRVAQGSAEQLEDAGLQLLVKSSEGA